MLNTGVRVIEFDDGGKIELSFPTDRCQALSFFVCTSQTSLVSGHMTPCMQACMRVRCYQPISVASFLL